MADTDNTSSHQHTDTTYTGGMPTSPTIEATGISKQMVIGGTAGTTNVSTEIIKGSVGNYIAFVDPNAFTRIPYKFLAGVAAVRINIITGSTDLYINDVLLYRFNPSTGASTLLRSITPLSPVQLLAGNITVSKYFTAYTDSGAAATDHLIVFVEIENIAAHSGHTLVWRPSEVTTTQIITSTTFEGDIHLRGNSRLAYEPGVIFYDNFDNGDTGDGFQDSTPTIGTAWTQPSDTSNLRGSLSPNTISSDSTVGLMSFYGEKMGEV